MNKIYFISIFIFTFFTALHAQEQLLSTWDIDDSGILSSPKADFRASDTIACIGENVVFTDSSSMDSCCHVWNFGTGASLLSGTQGEGPQ